jgi:steroid Delta-isomerase
MPSAEANTEANAETVNRYLELLAKGQADAIADLYATDATVEDPVGGEVHIGRQAIHGFYSNVPGTNNETEVVTLRALGSEVAFFWRLIVDLGEGGKMTIEIISVMTFDDEGKIASMKAYWGPDNIKQG